ncbi:ABC transporter substrate-binding protein [Acidihalobacter yilgarnensis]|uniref:ABC transporter substrate-binding protein n=1 Tax=Acidihalobacter yilgarnensis TaxID=2819280 RepID=A0A1D8IPY8_9GAMM|nr:TRAP transporter substrate-binding protein [Acidihalobacter yilgarnensis]AOU98568.1 ABC transporter substrate-binding protein [Acidihalobacter yilgarnensis]
MKRRDFIKGGTVGLAAGAAALAAPAAFAEKTSPRLRWRLAASWPISLDTVYGGAEFFAKRVGELTGGRFNIRVYAGGEIVGGLQVLDAVQQGTVEMGHTASYYYIGKMPSLAFDTTLPFGMNYRQQNSWQNFGGGNDLLNKEVFSQFNIVSLPAGNTGTQMGGWFRKPLEGLGSLKGLKMRIPGFGGKVMARLGVNVQTLAGAEIYPALERGVIDATEWVGPYDDQKLGFYRVAKNYYYPSWWEPSTQFSLYVNKTAWDKLPKEYQAAVHAAAAEVNVRVMAHYDAVNPPALKQLIDKGVTLRPFSKDIMEAAQKNAFELYEELAAKDPTWRKIYGEWKKYRGMEYAWFNVAEQGFADFAFPQVPRSEL